MPAVLATAPAAAPLKKRRRDSLLTGDGNMTISLRLGLAYLVM